MTAEAATVQEKLENLPAGPGVYQHKDADGKVLYVGKAKNLRNRVRQYFQKSRNVEARIERMLAKATDLEIIVTDSEVEALILEANLIKKLKPRYNVNLKDDKSYPYVVITNEPYPRVFVTRQIRRDGSRYFGPYTDVKNVRSALKAVRDIFMIRSCNYFIDDEVIKKRKIKICLDYHIKKCEGPCEGLVSQQNYNAMIDQVASLLQGKTETLIQMLREDMNRLAAEMKFEEAAVLRDRITGLEAYSEKQKAVDLDQIDRDIFAFAAEGDDACGVIFKIRDGKMIGRQHYYMSNVEEKPEAEILGTLLQQYYLEAEYIPKEIFLPAEIEDNDAVQRWLSEKRRDAVSLIHPTEGEEAKLVRLSQSNARFLLDELKIQKMKRAGYVPHAVKALQRDLRLEKLPRRIECFDNSNIQGSDPVASMVVFVDGKPKKSEYRKFKIKSVVGPDDFASMREIVERRYTRVLNEGLELPDLIIVDGGKGQLSSAVDVLKKVGLHEQPIIGLAKRLEEVFLPGKSEPELLPKSSSGLRLLQQIRDEAHRFAITFHRLRRSKRTLQTELDLIEGIGKKRAKELLEVFGSVQGVKFATTEQIAEVVGEKVAGKIAEYFSDSDTEEATDHNAGK
ncbi:MAG: excinuclease ABC subunit UvrC [Bacteroidetes bacterium]|nr:excinuclease ABC subunit UvrC [Bacteroidota bacterium]MCW5894314.1 excinuclease ABC subunit UvrC [Bacteroidota bacterium]